VSVPPAVARPVPPRQLDLFVDGRDALLVHDVVTALRARHLAWAREALARLAAEHPGHVDVPALTLLVDALAAPAPAPGDRPALVAAVESAARGLVPAARRLLREHAEPFLRPWWQGLATAAAGLAFDPASPCTHRGWLCQQYGDWDAVRASIEAEATWPRTPVLRHWLGVARHHLGAPEDALALWLPVCWMDPARFARFAPALPNVALRTDWEAFERIAAFEPPFAETVDPAAWFPAWLLLRRPGLARVLAADLASGGGLPAQVLRHLVAMVPYEQGRADEELIRRRRVLRQLAPDFFRYYMATRGGVEPGRTEAGRRGGS
jgi:hypothetical protein